MLKFVRGLAFLGMALLPFLATSEFIRCGNPTPSRALIQRVRELNGREKCTRAPPYFKPLTVTIPTYIHVVAFSEAQSQEITDSVLQQQMKILNEGYHGTGMRYELKGISRTVNADWTLNKDQESMKRHLRRGDYGTLNLYYQNEVMKSMGPGQVYLGQCTFPEPVTAKPAKVFMDGCRMIFSTLPGGNDGAFLGRATVHEVGHWHGLLHTFEGGCEEGPVKQPNGMVITGGDLVCDTPAEADPGDLHGGDRCTEGRDSCPGSSIYSDAGPDAIHNYMNYAEDKCLTNFTPGQIKRMHDMWAAFRMPPSEYKM